MCVAIGAIHLQPRLTALCIGVNAVSTFLALLTIWLAIVTKRVSNSFRQSTWREIEAKSASQTDFGVIFYLLDGVVFKADY
ncbi:hypothetical protein Sde_3985 [Saccharophagus degradans 2-40]|uniref:Uncharacterized protein n=1 Tax=Saccharophagus degradans (strain 2-40 / ATCC 43961 / DSM 17024) TaxID=203122 RepID=Q21DI9_SACD2|nr:hypothetical protein Sde_3985 [Saccharophagus degradans 2-40]